MISQMREQELFIEAVGLFKFMQYLADRLPPDEYEVIARIEEDYLHAVIDKHVLEVTIQKLDQH
jgi:hypothetical protein